MAAAFALVMAGQKPAAASDFGRIAAGVVIGAAVGAALTSALNNKAHANTRQRTTKTASKPRNDTVKEAKAAEPVKTPARTDDSFASAAVPPQSAASAPSQSNVELLRKKAD